MTRKTCDPQIMAESSLNKARALAPGMHAPAHSCRSGTDAITPQVIEPRPSSALTPTSRRVGTVQRRRPGAYRGRLRRQEALGALRSPRETAAKGGCDRVVHD